jgi:MmyB-like transcription regulator ligand binding domain
LGPATGECDALPDSVHRMLQQVSPYPALVLNPRYDVIAYNDAYSKIVIDLSSIPIEERNILWLTFVSEEWQCAFIDSESVKLHMVAGYRAALAEHLGDPVWQDFTDRLLANSPLFAELWDRYDVAAPSTRIKVLENARVGLLRIEPVNLWLSQRGQHRATVYTPADEETDRKLHLLVTP